MNQPPITVADFMAAGMGLPALEQPPIDLPPGSKDRLYGVDIASGYNVWDVVPDTASEYLKTLRGNPTGYVSEATARAFKGCWNMGAWALFADGTGVHPLINTEAARKENRPAWNRLVRDIWPARQGERIVIILTTDTKKRIWPFATVGILGPATAVYMHDTERNVSGVHIINWPKLLDVLDYVETLYTLGFTKPGMGVSILREQKAMQIVGIQQTIEHENRLRTLRGTPEFVFSTIIAQKQEIPQ